MKRDINEGSPCRDKCQVQFLCHLGQWALGALRTEPESWLPLPGQVMGKLLNLLEPSLGLLFCSVR